MHLLLLAVGLFPSPANAEPEPRPEPKTEAAPRYLEIGARVGPRIADCPGSCDRLTPGVGLGGFLGVRAHHHFAGGFMAGYERFLQAEDEHPFRGMSYLGLYARGYVLRHSTFEPYAEIAGLGARPVGRCTGTSASNGEFGYRGSIGADWRIGPGLKLGAAASYLRARFGCGGSAMKVIVIPEPRVPPGPVGGFGVEFVITGVPF